MSTSTEDHSELVQRRNFVFETCRVELEISVGLLVALVFGLIVVVFHHQTEGCPAVILQIIGQVQIGTGNLGFGVELRFNFTVIRVRVLGLLHIKGIVIGPTLDAQRPGKIVTGYQLHVDCFVILPFVFYFFGKRIIPRLFLITL